MTPASGYIIPASALAFGVIGAIGCRAAVQFKKLINVDDALDVLAIHGVGGLLGTILVGIFGQRHISEMDGVSSIPGGWFEENWFGIVYQLAGCGATTLWSLLITFAILFVMNKIPGLRLRVKAEANGAGIDSLQMGEKAYDYDPIQMPEKHVGGRRSSVAAALYHIKRFTVNED